MLTYVLTEGESPLYQQLYEKIKNDIISGNLRAGEKLPSKRTFARNNGISTITIQNAYDQLISEGYIYTLPRKGYFVEDISTLPKSIKNIEYSLDIKVPEAKPQYRMDLSGNRTKRENFPFTVWAKLSREVISEKSMELIEPSPCNGIYQLRVAIANHLKSYRGMLVDPNQIVIGAGTQYLYGILVQLLGFDKSYCIENPGYKKLIKIYGQYQIDCHYADIDDQGMTVQGLKNADADIAHICPNHHFPTGITMPVSRRYEILSWVNEKNGRYIIEDDYDSEFRNSGRPISTLFSIDACEKVIYMNTFSKSLTPTIRISYMVLPVHLANRFYEKLSFTSCTVSNFEQYTLAEFISRGYFEKHINRMRLYYSRIRKQLMDIFEKSSLRDKCQIIESDSGLHFLMKLESDLSESSLRERLESKGIYMQSMADYYMAGSPKKEHLYIINYSDIDIQKISEVFEVISTNM